MHQDIIDKLKKNEKPFGLMGKELVLAMKELGPEHMEQFSSRWVSDWDKKGFFSGNAYRLRPKYEPEPKVIRCKIYESEDHLHFMHDSSEHSIGQACDHANFDGYNFDMLDDETHSEAWLNLDLEYNSNHKWTHASHVRFSK